MHKALWNIQKSASTDAPHANGLLGLLHSHSECRCIQEWRRCVLTQRMLPPSPGGSKYFRLFLASEYSEENLDFWIEVEKFKRLKDDKKLNDGARKIFEKFVAHNSKHEVCVYVHMRRSGAPPTGSDHLAKNLYKWRKCHFFASEVCWAFLNLVACP